MEPLSSNAKNQVHSLKKLVYDSIRNGSCLDDYVDGSNTLLHLSVEFNLVDCVQKLLSAGADSGVQNEKNLTPQDIALDNGNQILLQIFSRRDDYRAHLIQNREGSANNRWYTPNAENNGLEPEMLKLTFGTIYEDYLSWTDSARCLHLKELMNSIRKQELDITANINVLCTKKSQITEKLEKVCVKLRDKEHKVCLKIWERLKEERKIRIDFADSSEIVVRLKNILYDVESRLFWESKVQVRYYKGLVFKLWCTVEMRVFGTRLGFTYVEQQLDKSEKNQDLPGESPDVFNLSSLSSVYDSFRVFGNEFRGKTLNNSPFRQSISGLNENISSGKKSKNSFFSRSSTFQSPGNNDLKPSGDDITLNNINQVGPFRRNLARMWVKKISTIQLDQIIRIDINFNMREKGENKGNFCDFIIYYMSINEQNNEKIMKTGSEIDLFNSCNRKNSKITSKEKKLKSKSFDLSEGNSDNENESREGLNNFRILNIQVPVKNDDINENGKLNIKNGKNVYFGDSSINDLIHWFQFLNEDLAIFINNEKFEKPPKQKNKNKTPSKKKKRIEPEKLEIKYNSIKTPDYYINNIKPTPEFEKLSEKELKPIPQETESYSPTSHSSVANTHNSVKHNLSTSHSSSAGYTTSSAVSSVLLDSYQQPKTASGKEKIKISTRNPTSAPGKTFSNASTSLISEGTSLSASASMTNIQDSMSDLPKTTSGSEVESNSKKSAKSKFSNLSTNDEEKQKEFAIKMRKNMARRYTEGDEEMMKHTKEITSYRKFSLTTEKSNQHGLNTEEVDTENEDKNLNSPLIKLHQACMDTPGYKLNHSSSDELDRNDELSPSRSLSAELLKQGKKSRHNSREKGFKRRNMDINRDLEEEGEVLTNRATFSNSNNYSSDTRNIRKNSRKKNKSNEKKDISSFHSFVNKDSTQLLPSSHGKSFKSRREPISEVQQRQQQLLKYFHQYESKLSQFSPARLKRLLTTTRMQRSTIEARLVTILKEREVMRENLTYLQALRVLADCPPSAPTRSLLLNSPPSIYQAVSLLKIYREHLDEVTKNSRLKPTTDSTIRKSTDSSDSFKGSVVLGFDENNKKSKGDEREIDGTLSEAEEFVQILQQLRDDPTFITKKETNLNDETDLKNPNPKPIQAPLKTTEKHLEETQLLTSIPVTSTENSVSSNSGNNPVDAEKRVKLDDLLQARNSGEDRSNYDMLVRLEAREGATGSCRLPQRLLGIPPSSLLRDYERVMRFLQELWDTELESFGTLSRLARCLVLREETWQRYSSLLSKEQSMELPSYEELYEVEL